MNYINKKFKALLIREFKYLETIFEKDYVEFEKAKIDEVTPTTYKMGIRPDNLVIKFQNRIESSKKIWRARYIKEHSAQFEEIRKLNRIITLFYNSPRKHCFDDYETLQKYFDKFNLSKIEQGQVLAFFLNYTILYFREYRYKGNEEEIDAAIKEVVERNSAPKTSKREKKQKIEKEIADFDKNQELCYRRYSLLRTLINEGGILQPVEYAFELIGIKNILKEEMSEEQAETLLAASVMIAKDMKEERLKAEISNYNLNIAREKTDRSLKNSLKQQRIASKEEREARFTLQSYLKEDKPICFIGDNLDIVLSLLRKAGYAEIKINEIKRNILINDNNILKKEQKELFNKACETYLDVVQRSLMDMVNTILTNPDAIKNPVFFDMQATYATIKLSLLKLIQEKEVEDFSYEVDYLGLCLAELKELLASYRASSYKLVLEQNSN